jgi:crotonobetainyl-CoA:carnitine CoA-transferase CaiB-like acyl-CoA transferase
MYCPKPGEHTDEILDELKLTKQQIADLKQQGVVQ